MYRTRHTFASNALAAAEAPSWVAAMLGHASPEMLCSVYALHSEPHAPGRERTRQSDGGEGDGHETCGGGRCGTPEILPLKTTLTK